MKAQSGKASNEYIDKLVARSYVKGNTETLEFHSHNYYEIYLFHSGKCKYLIDNEIIEMSPGMILFMDGRSVHKAHVTGDAGQYIRSYVHFSSEWILDLIEILDLNDLFTKFDEKSYFLFKIDGEITSLS